MSKVDRYFDVCKCVNCGRSFLRSRQDKGYRRIKFPNVRSRNCVTCSKKCSINRI